MIDYILFDLDGTLTDPKEGITRCVSYALRSFGIIEDDLDKLTKFIGPPLLDSFMEFYCFDEEQARHAIEVYRERFSTIGVFENGVYEGIIPMLRKLRDAGKVLALSTSKPWVFAERILEKFGLAEYFTVVVGSELDGRLTDKAEVIAETLARLENGADVRERSIMVGDRRHDIAGAKKNGILSLGVKFGYAEENELEEAGADYIAEAVANAERILLSL